MSLVLYDAKDLVTHAVCVGMTGSGKTGLGLTVIEEAAIDNIPVLAIDPKGDLSNLLLTFPSLTGSDFAPWVDPSDASARGLDPTRSRRSRLTRGRRDSPSGARTAIASRDSRRRQT